AAQRRHGQAPVPGHPVRIGLLAAAAVLRPHGRRAEVRLPHCLRVAADRDAGGVRTAVPAQVGLILIVVEPSLCSAVTYSAESSRARARLYRQRLTAWACAPGGCRWRGRARSAVGGRSRPTRIPARPAAVTACLPQSAA